jgi:hypothetical protein
MHLLSRIEFLLAHDRQIIFGITRHTAGITSTARIQIDAHGPLVFLMRLVIHRMHMAEF